LYPTHIFFLSTTTKTGLSKSSIQPAVKSDEEIFPKNSSGPSNNFM
jgi:hypothetical protein